MDELETTQTNEEPSVTYEVWDNSKRARIVQVVFWIMIGFTFVSIASNYLELDLLLRIQEGELVDEATANASDQRQGVIGILQTILTVISAVVFLNWFRRAYGNLHRVDAENLHQKESMSVWVWFIPILSLYEPVKIMKSIWTETQKSIQRFNPAFVLKNGTLAIGVWWTLFLLSNFIGRYILKTTFKDDTIEDYINSSRALLVSDIMQVPEALILIYLVYYISITENQLAEEVTNAGGRVVLKEA